MMNSISYSSMKTYLRCPRQYYFSYELRLRRLEKANHRADLGGLISKVLEIHYHNDGVCSINISEIFESRYKIAKEETLAKLPEVTKTAEAYWAKIYKEGTRALAGYHTFTQANDNFKVLEVEQKRSLPLDDDWEFHYIPDLVIEQDGRVAILDHKLRGELKLLELQLDPQLKLYSWALREQMELDYYPDIVYNCVIDGSPQVEYVRVPIAVNETMIKYPHMSLTWVLGRIRVSKKWNEWIPSYMWNCNLKGTGCDYPELCTCIEQGNDIEPIIEELFEVKE